MIEIVPIDFMGQQGALLEPKHKHIHDLAVDYCQRELVKEVDLSKFAKVWLGLKDGKAFGVAGYVLRADVPLMRATDADVLRALGKRMNDFFSDQGIREQEVFIFIGDEKPEQRCPEWKQVLKEFGATSAQRWQIEVK